MTQINVTVNDKILEDFRAVIYSLTGLQKGDLKKYLEIAIAEYIIKYTKSKGARKFAKEYVQKLQIA